LFTHTNHKGTLTMSDIRLISHHCGSLHQQVRRAQPGTICRVARCVFVNKNPFASSLHLGKGRAPPPVASPRLHSSSTHPRRFFSAFFYARPVGRVLRNVLKDEHMPRPKQATPKSRIVSFRLTEEEFANLTTKAARAGTTVNALARKLVLANVQRLVIKAEAAIDPALITQLYRIGHNLNQLVKNAHIYGRISPRTEQLCQRIETLVNKATGE